jgi:hypothetical protein
MNGFPAIPPAPDQPASSRARPSPAPPMPAQDQAPAFQSSLRTIAALFTVMLFGVAMMLPPVFAGQHLVGQALAACAITVVGFALAAGLGWLAYVLLGRSPRIGAAVFSILILLATGATALLSAPGLRFAGPWLEHAGFSHDSVQSLTGQASSPSHAGKSPVVRVYRQQSPTASVPTQP